ncbi:uncharacterized protein CANTADRAFT_4888 [Suhomyces tanzawaensis NRRL Y-17324]|uniref:Uncharacterized protein n=1 Tax=Suhomyces tanzawaensis NRRL Y-17324 TaxID=984487 RepID=A0A1E4SMY6_9ASCO|nr:uncharacterized protein CANTADRAFT_4888 [Suhomyces tanzawaensis NRRL Y-17324]ODV80894.1 hypothetical protein CANTADRAFT_4888 [Suhomyces tanzawaensis NRRL Y-17324]
MYNSVKAPLRRVGLRFQSSDSKNSVFLSDLFKRIEEVTAKTKDIKPAERPKKTFNKKKPLNKKPATLAAKPAPQQPQNVIKVQDHSLMNSFGQSYAQFATTGGAPRGPPRTPRTPRAPGVRTARGPRPPRSDAPAPSAARPAPQRQARPTRQRALDTSEKDGKVPSKKLVAQPLVPQLGGNTFFYGKLTTVNPCVTSRVASITKEALLKSKYPYLAPKHIIDHLPEGPQNKFLLQNNYSLEVDQDAFTSRFNEVVKGTPQQINVGVKGAQAEFTRAEIMKNGTLNVANKQTLFDIVNGLKSPKDLFANAAWAKK